MKKVIAIALAALVTTVSSPAGATQPCEGSSTTCSWTCSTDGQGNIVNYSVTCEHSEWCVGSDGSVDIGLCDSVAPPPSEDPVLEAFEELTSYDDAMAPGTCQLPPPKAPAAK